MKLTSHGVPAPGKDTLPAEGALTASRVTHYLSAAAHLRQPMLPREITEMAGAIARPPLPVGRSYARRVLFTAEGAIPMSAVNISEVRKHCRIALLQTTIRDVLAIGSLLASAVLDPWGTAVTFSIVAAIVILPRRVRVPLPLLIAAAIGATLGILTTTPHEQISFAIPLASLVICLIIYLADIWLSMHHVRKIWQGASPPAAKPRRARHFRMIRLRPRSLDPAVSGEPTRDAGWSHTSVNGHRRNQGNAVGERRAAAAAADATEWGDGLNEAREGDKVLRIPEVSRPSRVYYDKRGIVGAGEAQTPLTLTVPVDKRLDPDAPIGMFSASELIGYVGIHLLSQGPGDESVHGLAYHPLAGDTNGQNAYESGHFTYGLPYLDVGTVVATPLPTPRKTSPVRRATLPLLYHVEPSADEILGVTNRSPSEHPERHYIRATTSSWDGQIVASVFLNAALQGHFLRLIIRPYLLSPIVSIHPG